MVDKTKRLIFVSALAFSIVATSLSGAKEAYAQDTNTQAPLVQMIADKFGLKTSDVQAIFDQHRQNRLTQMKAKYEQMLTDAVTRGQITSEQKQLLLEKHAELEAKRATSQQSTSSLSKEERKALMEKEKTELETWTKEHNIDIKYLFGGFGRHGYFGWKK